MDASTQQVQELESQGFRSARSPQNFWAYYSPDYYARNYMQATQLFLPDPKDKQYDGKEGEKGYYRDLLWYYLYASTDVVMARHAMWRECENMYNRLLVSATNDPSNMGDDKDIFPATNSIFQVIERRAGEFASRMLKFKVAVTNQAARSRREEFYNERAVEKWMKVNMPNALEFLGEGAEGQVKEMDEMEKALTPLEHRPESYRDYVQESAQKILNDYVEQSKFDRACKSQAREYQKTSCSFFFSEVNPVTLEVDFAFLRPEEVFFDPGIQDDFGRGCKFAGFYRYYSLQELKRRYPDVKDKEWEDMATREAVEAPLGHWYGWDFVDHRRGYTQVLVMRAWIVQVEYRTYEEMDEAAGMSEEKKVYNKSVREEAAEMINALRGEGDGIDLDEKYPVEEIVEVVMVGDRLLEYGRAKNQVRSVDAFARANLPIKMLINGYGARVDTPPRVLRIRVFEQMRNSLWMKFQSMLTQINPGYTVVYPSRLSSTITGSDDPQNMIQMLLDNQIIVAKEGGFEEMDGSRQAPPVEMITPGQSAAIQQVIGGIQYIDAQIDTLTSNNAARSGTSGQYASPDVVSANKTQSDMETYLEDNQYIEHLGECATQVANMEKMATSLRRKRNVMQQTASDADLMRVGDLTYGIIDERLTFEDLGVTIDAGLPQPQMRQLLVTSASHAMENGHIDMATYVEVLQYEDIDEAIRKLKFEVEKGRKEKEKEMQQQMQMQEQQMQMQAQMKEKEQVSKQQHEEKLTKIKEAGNIAATKVSGAMSIASAEAANKDGKKKD